MVLFYNHLYIRFRPYKYIPTNIFYYFHAKAVRGAFRLSQYKFIPYLIKMITKFHSGTFFDLFSIIACTRKSYNCSQNLVPSGLRSNFIIIVGRTQYNKLQWIVFCLTSETQIDHALQPRLPVLIHPLHNMFVNMLPDATWATPFAASTARGGSVRLLVKHTSMDCCTQLYGCRWHHSC